MFACPTSVAGVAMAVAAGAVVAGVGVCVAGAGAAIQTKKDVAVLGTCHREPYAVGVTPSTLTCAVRERKEA